MLYYYISVFDAKQIFIALSIIMIDNLANVIKNTFNQ